MDAPSLKSAAPTTGAVRTPRLASIDWLRSLALFEVIGFHTRHGRVPGLAGLGLPLLLVITNLFNCPLAHRRGLRTLVRDKVRRLFVPWLFWCAVFAIMISLEAIHMHTPVRARFSPKMLLVGTYNHLWFAPFAIFGGFAVGALQSWTRAWAPVVVTVSALGAGALLVLLGPVLTRQLGGGPFGVWIFSLPSVMFGLALGRTLLISDRTNAQRVLLGVLAVAGATWIAVAVAGGSWVVFRYAGALSLIALALLLRVRDPYVAPFLAPLSLGIYFVHPIALRTLMALHAPWQSSVVWALAGFALAILLVVVMRRTPLRPFV